MKGKAMRAIIGDNNVSFPTVKNQAKFKYVVTAERDGYTDSVLCSGELMGVAHFASKHGPYAFNSYKYSGYLSGRRIAHDSGLVALFLIPTGKGDMYISVQINPAYHGNTY